jgi:hypothetical protein
MFEYIERCKKCATEKPRTGAQSLFDYRSVCECTACGVVGPEDDIAERIYVCGVCQKPLRAEPFLQTTLEVGGVDRYTVQVHADCVEGSLDVLLRRRLERLEDSERRGEIAAWTQGKAEYAGWLRRQLEQLREKFR